MARPTVAIVLREPPIVGRTCTVEFQVTVDKLTPVEFIDARLEGQQGWRIGGGKSAVSHHAALPRLEVRLMEAGELPAATTSTFVLRFDLPAGAAPSHDLAPAFARLRLDLHISIPWRLDGRYTFMLPARLPPPARVERTPAIARSAPVTSAADGPRLELSLASSALVVGEVVVGSVALFHTDDRKPREVELMFMPVLTLAGRGRERERVGVGMAARVVVPAGAAGTAVPFRVELPPTTTPSFATRTHQLHWRLVASTDSLFTARLSASCGLTLVDAAAAATATPLAAAPRIADQWIETVFTVVAAATGWRFVPAGDDEDQGPALVGEVAGGEASVRYAYRGTDGTFLVSRLAHAPLGLGLTVTPGSALRHWLWSDVEIDLAAWDRAHHVVARFSAQAAPFLRAVAPAQMATGALGTLARWDDDAMVFERPMGRIAEAELRLMIETLTARADTLDRARAAISPPPEPVVDLAAWRELATSLTGELTPGDLGVDGTLAGLPVRVEVLWHDARAVAIRAWLGDPTISSPAVRACQLHLPRPLADVLTVRASDAVLDCLARWPAELVDLADHDGVAAASLPLTGDGPRAIDPERARALLHALRALVAALDPAGSPYR